MRKWVVSVRYTCSSGIVAQRAKLSSWNRAWSWIFLNVHEGPHSIRAEENPNPILENSIISNEPGLYRARKHGIRIENLVVTNKWKETEFGKFSKFETVTLCVIDKIQIVVELLLEEEKQRLNDYHKVVFEKISPSVEGDVLEWLKNATESI